MTHDIHGDDRQNGIANGDGGRLVRRFASVEEVAQAGAERFVEVVSAALEKNERCSVVLGGGTTYLKMYGLLVERKDIDWGRVHLFIGDERFVPATNAQSNRDAIRKAFMDQIDIPKENIHLMRTEGVGLEEAARMYEEEILRYAEESRIQNMESGEEEKSSVTSLPFGATSFSKGGEGRGASPAPLPLSKGSTPRETRGEGFLFDLALLGIGPDGHTLSIFPGSEETTRPSDHLVIAVHDSPKPPAERITLTYKAVNQAKNILFLVTGVEKKEALEAILNGPEDRVKWPAQGIRLGEGRVEWVVGYNVLGGYLI